MPTSFYWLPLSLLTLLVVAMAVSLRVQLGIWWPLLVVLGYVLLVVPIVWQEARRDWRQHHHVR